MTMPHSSAANAYAALANIGIEKKPKIAALGAGEEGEGLQDSKFGGMVNESVNGFINQGEKAESAMLKSSTGTGNIVDTVTAMSETELQLNTIVALRDRVIDAYEKIMNMPV